MSQIAHLFLAKEARPAPETTGVKKHRIETSIEDWQIVKNKKDTKKLKSKRLETAKSEEEA